MPEKILIVDDDPEITQLLSEISETDSLSPFVARNLAEARELALAKRPDVVLLDVYLPDGLGPSFISYLRELDATVEVIVMTSGTRFDIIVEAMRKGASDFLCKPFSIEDTKQVVAQALERRRKNRGSGDPVTLKSVLLVDGEARSLVSMGNVLAEHGIAIFQALDAAEAISILDTHTIDLVIAEGSTPAAPGLSILDEVKRRQIQLPVIFVSANDDLQVAIQALRAGAFDMVLKPFKRTAFEESLMAAWQHKAALRERGRLERELQDSRAMVVQLQQVLEQERARKQSAFSTKALETLFQDITQKKRLESHLKISDRLAAVGIMLSDLTRELTGPLNVALGYTDLLLRDTGDPTRARAQIEKIQTALKKAGEITSRLTKFQEIPTTSEPRPVDLHQTIKTVLGLLERRFALHSHGVDTTELTSARATIVGDPVELQQVFVNLLMYVTDSLPDQGAIRISSRESDGLIELRIADNGKGLPEGHSARIFEPLFAEKAGARGTEQGLAICKSAIERNGGLIEVSSDPGKGMTFTIAFTLASAADVAKAAAATDGSEPAGSGAPADAASGPRGEAPAAGPDATGVPEPTGNKVVGLLSDATAGNESYQLWLQNAGFEVHQCVDAAAAIRSLSAEAPIILVVDLGFPGLDAPVFISELMSRPSPPGLVLLGNLQNAYLPRAILSGIRHRVLESSINQRNFLKAVKSLFEEGVNGPSGD